MRSLAAYGEVFVRNVMASGVIPQISLILGPCAGGAVYSPALTDFVIMIDDSFMFLTGPDVIKAVTGEDVTALTLGGAGVHTTRSGVAHLAAPTEVAGLTLAKLLLSYLPQNNNEDPPQLTPDDPTNRMDEALNSLIPRDENEPYDVRDALAMVFDRDSFLEIQPHFAAECGRRLHPARRVFGGRGGEPARLHVGRAQHRRERQDRALHPDLRRVQHPDRHVHRLPGLPAGHRPGVRRRDPARRQDHLRLLRSRRCRRSRS